MKTIKRITGSLGVDGWIYGISGIAAIVFSTLSFLGVLPFDQKQVSSIVIGAVGLLLVAITTQTAKKHAEILELKGALGVSDSQLLTKKQAGTRMVLSIAETKILVLDAFMSPQAPILASSQSFFSGWPAEYRKLLFQRIGKGDIEYKRVQVIPHRQSLEEVILRLLLHEGHRYYIRHYDTPPKAIPMLNILSFDDETFYLSADYQREAARQIDFLYIREPKLPELLKSYWNVLWEQAIPLNEGGFVNWEELKRISLRLGMPENEFDAMVSDVRSRVQRDKRLGR